MSFNTFFTTLLNPKNVSILSSQRSYNNFRIHDFGYKGKRKLTLF